MRLASPLSTIFEAVGSQITAPSSLPARKFDVIPSMFWFRYSFALIFTFSNAARPGRGVIGLVATDKLHRCAGLAVVDIGGKSRCGKQRRDRRQCEVPSVHDCLLSSCSATSASGTHPAP